MSALTVPLPDNKHMRLRALASSWGTNINRLIDQLIALMLAEFDVKAGFARGLPWVKVRPPAG